MTPALFDTLALGMLLLLWACLGALLGGCAYATTEIIRRLPGVEPRMLQGDRPWSCDLCMSFWTSAIWHAGVWVSGAVPVDPMGHGVAFALSIATSLVLLGFASSLPPPTEPPV